MKLQNENADILVPDGADVAQGLARTTHLAIGAHQDDLEIMAFHGIRECFARSDLWFGGVICTNGAGSARSGRYAKFTDEEMQAVRREEQRSAARIGGYSVMLQLDYSSSALKDVENAAPGADLDAILNMARPKVLYTHNPADKHATHIAVVSAVVAAVRRMAPADRPEKLLGCEVWRDLDWMLDEHKVVMDLSGYDNLAAALVSVFDSQIAGGKRYDLATQGRRRANATYLASHGVDDIDAVAFAMDLTPLIKDDQLDVVDFVMQEVNAFGEDVRRQLAAMV